jgi:sulfoxide reductase heme-binding subunit YedZ
MKTKSPRFTPLQILVHVYAWSAIARILIDFATDHLSPNFIQDLEQRTGRHAITLLMLSLLCTPLNTLFKWREPIKRRRALGLYAFMYAVIHVIIFVDLDFGLAWSLIFQTVFEKPFILVGLTTFLLLIPLAFTSFDIWKERLGKNWKRLHQLVYFAGAFAVLHYAWSKKGDLFRLQGDILKPLLYSLALLLLLVFRIPTVRKFLAALQSRLMAALYRLRKQPKRDALKPVLKE